MVIKDIREILIKKGIEKDITLSMMPSNKDEVITLYTVGGAPTGTISGSGLEEIYNEPFFQINVRSKSNLEAYNTLKDIKEILLSLGKIDINKSRYYRFFNINDIIDLGRDNNERTIMTIQFRTYFDDLSYIYDNIEKNIELLLETNNLLFYEKIIELILDNNIEDNDLELRLFNIVNIVKKNNKIRKNEVIIEKIYKNNDVEGIVEEIMKDIEEDKELYEEVYIDMLVEIINKIKGDE